MKSLVMISLLASASFSASAPLLSEDLPRSSPESQGLASAGLMRVVSALESRVDHLHSLMILRRGHVVAEGWWAPYAAERPHELYSLSKSFAATAMGLLIQEGKASLDDPVVKFFPEYVPSDAGNLLKEMRIRDLLCMSTGQENADISKVNFGSAEPIAKQFLAVPVRHKPGTLFVYNTAATYMLGAILKKVTGQTLTEYLTPRLYEPLGIRNAVWNKDQEGIDLGGFGLNVTTEDIAKFGQLYLQRGEWNGRRILDPAWVELATSKQASNGSNPNSDWDQGYGYQFWRCRGGFYRGDGAFGQFCIVLPQHEMVVAITAGTGDMGAVMNVLWDTLLPEVRAARLPAAEADHAALKAKLKSLTLPVATGTARPSSAIVGKSYLLDGNPLNLSDLTVSEKSVRVTIGGVTKSIPLGSANWNDLGEIAPNTMASASGAWTAPDTLLVKLALHEKPYVRTLSIKFAGNEVTVEHHMNVGFGGTAKSSFRGSAK